MGVQESATLPLMIKSALKPPLPSLEEFEWRAEPVQLPKRKPALPYGVLQVQIIGAQASPFRPPHLRACIRHSLDHLFVCMRARRACTARAYAREFVRARAPIIGVTAGIDRGALRAVSSDTARQASLAAALDFLQGLKAADLNGKSDPYVELEHCQEVRPTQSYCLSRPVVAAAVVIRLDGVPWKYVGRCGRNGVLRFRKGGAGHDMSSRHSGRFTVRPSGSRR